MTIKKYLKDKTQKDIFELDDAKLKNRNLDDVIKAIDSNTNELLILAPKVEILLKNQQKILKLLAKFNRK